MVPFSHSDNVYRSVLFTHYPENEGNKRSGYPVCKMKPRDLATKRVSHLISHQSIFPFPLYVWPTSLYFIQQRTRFCCCCCCCCYCCCCFSVSCPRIIFSYPFPYVWESNKCNGIERGFKIPDGCHSGKLTNFVTPTQRIKLKKENRSAKHSEKASTCLNFSLGSLQHGMQFIYFISETAVNQAQNKHVI